MWGIKFIKRGLVLSLMLLLVVPLALAQDDDENFCETAAEEIEYGDTVDGTLDDDAYVEAYCFEGEEDDEITIIAETTDGDLVISLILTDPFATDEIVSDTARNERDEAEISFTLPDDDTYMIIIVREDWDEGDTEGDYEMSFQGETSRRSGRNSSADVENFCEEDPIATLSQYQYGIAGSNPERPLIAFNVGCTGFLVASIAGVAEVAEYEIGRRGRMTFNIGETTYTTVDFDEDEWLLELGNGGELLLERIDSQACDDDPLSALIRGAWFDEDEQVFDFTCNGVILFTNEDGTSAGTYEVGRRDITIQLSGNQIVLEDFEIDDSEMHVEIDGDGFDFENLMD